MDHSAGGAAADRFLEVEYERLITDREAEPTADRVHRPRLETRASPERNKRTIKTASAWQGRQPVYASLWSVGGTTSLGSASCANCGCPGRNRRPVRLMLGTRVASG